jgi:hypothetical protein
MKDYGEQLHTQLKAIQQFRLALSNGPNRVGISLSSPEDASTFGFRNTIYIEYINIFIAGTADTPYTQIY